MKTLPLSQGKETLIDDVDYDKLSAHKWSLTTNRVTRIERSRGKKRTVYIHREIMNAPKGLEVDHINGNALDNRRCNLRLATHIQNMVNSRKPKGNHTSKYKGVHFDIVSSPSRPWKAHIGIYYKSVYIGAFKTEKGAAMAYDREARKAWGEFSNLNFKKEISNV